MAPTDLSDVPTLAGFPQLTDVDGRLILMPAATVHHFRRRGAGSVTLTVNLGPASVARPWVTVTEAARLHLSDVDGMTLERAKNRVSRACRSGQVISEGTGGRRRIEPNSLDAWRMAERERDLNRVDD